MVKKNELMGELGQAKLQKETLLEKIASNSASLESARVLVEAAQKEVLSESEIALREKKVNDLLAQKWEKETLEGLEKDMISKESIALADKKKADELLVAVWPKKSAYDAAVVQYEAKKTLWVELAALKALPRPSSAQRNARKTLESQALAASPAKRPTDAQVADRKKLEDLLVARDAAKKNIPTSTRAPGYQTALAAYNTLKNKYNADSATYKSTYASSAFSVNMTYAQLMVKVNQHATAVATYTTTLNVYNSTYPTNSGLTLVQIDGQIAAYNTANTAYNQKLTAYNTTYAATKNKTEAQLLVWVNTLKAPYDTAEAAHRAALNTYETVSKIASEKARSLYEQAQKVYALAHPSDTRTALVLGQVYVDEKGKHDTLVVENDRKKGILAGLVADQDKYTAIGERLSGEMKEVESLLVSLGEKLTPVEEKISWMEGRKCPATEQGLCDDRVDNNRDGTTDCADSYCLEFDPVCRPAVTCMRIVNANPVTITVPYGTPCPVCGNGIPEEGEQCDSGNSCSSECQWIDTAMYSTMNSATTTSEPVCWNWTQEGFEQCDGWDGCKINCQWDVNHGGTIECGDGICSSTETSGTCPQDCPYDNMVVGMTENKMSVVNECGNMICQEEKGETNMNCFNDCDDMIIALGLTKSGIITHEFTIEEITSLSHEELNSVVSILTTYIEKLGRYIEKLKLWVVEYDNCSNRACKDEILNRLREWQYFYSANFFIRSITYLTQFLTPNIYALDSSSWIQDSQENIGENMIRKLISDYSELEEQANNRLRKIREWRAKWWCTDPNASNYDSEAKYNDGSCKYYIRGCTDSSAMNFNPDANYEDGSCQYYIRGCMDSSASNYNANANYEDGSCTYEEEECEEEPDPSECQDSGPKPICYEGPEGIIDLSRPSANALKLAAASMVVAKRENTHGKCLKGVRMALEEGLGIKMPRRDNAYEAWPDYQKNSAFVEIPVCNQEMVKAASQLPGTIMFFHLGETPDRHIAIKQEQWDTSDFVSKGGCQSAITHIFVPK
jgi:hypothetical protein